MTPPTWWSWWPRPSTSFGTTPLAPDPSTSNYINEAKSKMLDKGGLGALHTMDYENSVKHWERYFMHHRQQNRILKDIVQNATNSGANATVASNASSNTNSVGTGGDVRVTTRSAPWSEAKQWSFFMVFHRSPPYSMVSFPLASHVFLPGKRRKRWPR